MQETTIVLSNSVMEVLKKAADEIGINVPNMAKLIISEWAMRQEQMNAQRL